MGSKVTVSGSGLRVVHIIDLGLLLSVVVAEGIIALQFGVSSFRANLGPEALIGAVILFGVGIANLTTNVKKVELSDEGVYFISSFGRLVFVSWGNLELPRYAPFLRLEVSFSQKAGPDAQHTRGYWVDRTMARAILEHPFCRRDGIPPITLAFLGLAPGVATR